MRERGRVEESRGAFSNRLLLYSQPYPVVPVLTPYCLQPEFGVRSLTRHGTSGTLGAGSIKLSYPHRQDSNTSAHIRSQGHKMPRDRSIIQYIQINTVYIQYPLGYSVCLGDSSPQRSSWNITSPSELDSYLYLTVRSTLQPLGHCDLQRASVEQRPHDQRLINYQNTELCL
jgi:hypothetical protein